MNNAINNALKQIETQLLGTIYFDDLMRSIYATDASVYRKLPLAVAFPKDANDIIKLIAFAENLSTRSAALIYLGSANK